MDDRHRTTRDIAQLTARSDRPAIAVLPVGCTEQHGPFLPLETDTLLARGMAVDLAERFRAAGHPVHVIPEIAYSPTRSSRSYPGSLSIAEQPFRDYVTSVVQALLASEFGIVILLSGHGPADPSLREISFIAVDSQFRAAQGQPKPVIPVSLGRASSVLAVPFGTPLGRHADWREFLLLHHLLGASFFTEARLHALEAFQRGNPFPVSHAYVPGVPLEYRSVEGVVGQPLPAKGAGEAEAAKRAWNLVLDQLFSEITDALGTFPRVHGP